MAGKRRGRALPVADSHEHDKSVVERFDDNRPYAPKRAVPWRLVTRTSPRSTISILEAAAGRPTDRPVDRHKLEANRRVQFIDTYRFFVTKHTLHRIAWTAENAWEEPGNGIVPAESWSIFPDLLDAKRLNGPKDEASFTAYGSHCPAAGLPLRTWTNGDCRAIFNGPGKLHCPPPRPHSTPARPTLEH